MNNFTKEELEHIFTSCAQHALEGWANISPLLLEKMQSMVDNYCEHEWHQSAIGAIYCIHCKKKELLLIYIK